jgi:hypothetical protein
MVAELSEELTADYADERRIQDKIKIIFFAWCCSALQRCVFDPFLSVQSVVDRF